MGAALLARGLGVISSGWDLATKHQHQKQHQHEQLNIYEKIITIRTNTKTNTYGGKIHQTISVIVNVNVRVLDRRH